MGTRCQACGALADARGTLLCRYCGAETCAACQREPDYATDTGASTTCRPCFEMLPTLPPDVGPIFGDDRHTRADLRDEREERREAIERKEEGR